MKSTVQLMTHLSKENRVLYVDYARTWLDVARALIGRVKAPVGRIMGWSPRLRKMESDQTAELFVLTPPPVAPINWLPQGRLYQMGQQFNARIVARAVRRAMRALDMSCPIVVNAFLPGLGMAMKGRLDEKMTVYYCYDEISEANWCAKHGASDEARFISDVDAVITTSDALWEIKERKTDFCYTVKNGVDCALFEQTVPLSLLSRASSGRQTVVGYVGCIDKRVDTELIVDVAKRFPDWTFQMVGPIVDPEAGRQLSAQGNVQLLGPRAAKELPEAMKNFHVGIIPFKRNEFTKFIYPLKINEYLAAGLPVVMTDFADIQEFRSAVYEATSVDSFAEALKKAVGSNQPAIISSRQQFARLNSWKNRSQQFGRILAYRGDQLRAA
jgi:glycosyltransferase involved in cell wall biosynthesis